MSVKFIKETDFNDFVGKMMEARTVVGPVAKKTKFVFGELESVDQLRLDYDVTILPPKKLFFPPRQDLLKFHGQKGTSCICPQPKVLFGVHYYDIKAIDQTDFLFNENNADQNYLANREATTIIGTTIQNVSPRAFFGSVGKNVNPKGHDGFLTRINGGWVFETLTSKGRDLLDFGKFIDADDAQKAEAAKVNTEEKTKSPEKIKAEGDVVAQKVRKSFSEDELWEEFAKDCFSCGSCNIVCPTCYCFDVQDNWNVDQHSGARTRSWDGCLKADFAECSLGQGACENFRETKGSRFRHRIMRKAVYSNEKLGGPACVGCGRCSLSCTADIADPVNVINRIVEG
ncbi:4Fe-4S dicluster domain-containing protein [Myxococcota bacterium]|nr:4Fe-4S dicluster domain-containing protein [Myxococcota bacterium]MBU1536382.1 4Fe-4S dicluster domain-containing protein [Myxococcota bacterium]